MQTSHHRTFQDGFSENLLGVSNTTVDQIIQGEVTVANNSNTNLAIAFDKDEIDSCWMLSDVDMYFKTNDGGTPDTNIALKAGIPFDWCRGDGYFANPFIAADVTVVILTRSGVGGTLKYRFGMDSTP